MRPVRTTHPSVMRSCVHRNYCNRRNIHKRAVIKIAMEERKKTQVTRKSLRFRARVALLVELGQKRKREKRKEKIFPGYGIV